MPVPLIDLGRQHEPLMNEIRDAFERIVKNSAFILGEEVERFEQALARYAGTKYAIGVTSGTDALLMALMALDIGPGDEVITSPFTFFATAGSISRVGAKPVFIDINPRTYNLQWEMIEGAITEKTKAIMPVHLFGLSAQMDKITEIAEKHGLKVIEDAAQALGARFGDKMVGSMGDVGCYSFYPTKNLAAMGDAGALVTNDGELACRLRCIRVHGMDRADHFPEVGGNFRLDAFKAAVLALKLPHLDTYCTQRRAHADRYGQQLEALPIGTPFEAETRYHVYNQYTVRVHGGAREPLGHHLSACGIGNRVYYSIPLHLQPCYQHLGQGRGSLPNAEEAADEVLSIPVFPEMTHDEQEKVIAAIREFGQAE
ncbi:DegT/DnrJ/EryC1/StrS family aminotransferase [Mucisphaera calidilacus]|uniref:Aminotransferase n=1 Tax=Mucisphaera calidilacus TaxID=2527982 RepID=A0A518BZ14_9BACT|nr:DegT/DnrJ/EryC1/StrS family aminotransferase [Mucisphaera calidilacus]QDU72210.1 Aminotransferase [Mucisphaera calidilacus]